MCKLLVISTLTLSCILSGIYYIYTYTRHYHLQKPRPFLSTVMALSHDYVILSRLKLNDYDERFKKKINKTKLNESKSLLSKKDTYPTVCEDGVAFFHQHYFDDFWIHDSQHRPSAIIKPEVGKQVDSTSEARFCTWIHTWDSRLHP